MLLDRFSGSGLLQFSANRAVNKRLDDVFISAESGTCYTYDHIIVITQISALKYFLYDDDVD